MVQILVLNPNGSARTTQAMVDIAAAHFADVRGYTQIGAPDIITTQAALQDAARLVPEVAVGSVAGVIVAAFGDPGRADLARRVTVPVVGIGEAAARAAARGGCRFAVATTTPLLKNPVDNLMRQHGAEGDYVGSFFTQGDVETLMRDEAALDAALIAACADAVAQGAARVIIGGGPLAQAAIRIAPMVSVPLIQPLPEACKAIAALVPSAGR
jgi:Asp/Glu/hydantoin racemase